MSYLYILSEDDNDDWFYEACLEKLTGKQFEIISRRLVRGSGLTKVRRNIRFLLDDIARSGEVDDTYFVISWDNDRCPIHPDHEKREGLSRKAMNRSCRFCDLKQTVEENLGTDRSQWPIKGAFAVPVEMLESWILLMLGYEADTLPIFAEKSQTSARNFYGNAPDDQLKDLCRIEQKKTGTAEKALFYVNCVYEHLDGGSLIQKSPSFAQFKTQVDEWMT